jgi:2-keto-4-pentenoate hydratase/2-oxohepta-3-ene-1,7-dioic acid hydratase in catechol pathway
MRLITFVRNGRESVGAFIDGDRQIVDIGGADPTITTMLALIEGGDATLARARAIVAAPPKGGVFSASECKLLAPLPRPTQIRDCLTFPAHLKGGARVQAERMAAASPDPAKTMAELEAAGRLDVPKTFYDFPLYYISNRMEISGPDVDVQWPPYSQTIDYEMEWAAVIGKPCYGVTKDSARASIFGYTIFNDWSARDEQFRAMQAGAINLGPARGKDFCNGVGPCIVTADEIPEPYALDMIVRVNGEEVSRGNSSGMHFKFEDLLAFLSEGTTLHPGELICSGTVGGGCSFETGQTLKDGDVIELEVEKIGTLRNRVVAPHIKR